MTDEKPIADAEALDRIAALYLGDMNYDNPCSALESISMLVESTGRKIEGRDHD